MWSCSSPRKKTPRKNRRPAKQKTPRIFPILGGVLGVLFRYRSIWHKCAACIRRMQHTKGLGLSQQAFCNAKMAFVYTNALLATTMRPFCPQFEIFRLEKNAMLTLEWIGKNKVVNHHQEVPFRVLERQYSFGEQGQHTENNDSENMIIHGDNLEALKALLPQYEGKVKCIYIVILTPILMSILSSENAVRLNFIIHIMFLALFEMRNYNVLCGGAKWTI